MDIKAYSTPGCFYCKQLKELFDRAGIEADIVDIPNHPDEHRKFREEHPDATGFPYVIIDGEYIGGLVDTAKIFLEKGMVTSKKK